MSDYIMSPGAELYVGPHGKPYESLGRSSSRKKPCCADCGSGKKKCGGDALGATLPPRMAGPSLTVGPPASPADTSPLGSMGPILIGGAAVIGIIWFLRRRKKNR